MDYLDKDDIFFNYNMVGRVSGFDKKKDAKTFSRPDEGSVIDAIWT